MNPRLTKWLRWLEVLKNEIQDLVIAKHTFHEIQGMIRDNPLLHRNSLFYDYLSRTYVSHVVIGVRRQIKCDGRSISLARLFEEMITTPKVFPRRYYTAKYKGSIVEDRADEDFDNFAEPGAPHISAPLIAIDLERLRKISKRCEEFADKRVAHTDKQILKQLPTFNEVDACIDLLDDLYVKYHRLYHAQAMDSLLPTWQYDWKAIFRVSWLFPIEEQI